MSEHLVDRAVLPLRLHVQTMATFLFCRKTIGTVALITEFLLHILIIFHRHKFFFV